MSNPYEGVATGNGTGVTGTSDSGDGVLGTSVTGYGLHGKNGGGTDTKADTKAGVFGESTTSHGVHGRNGEGVDLLPEVGSGVWGESRNGYGVYAASKTAAALYATNKSGVAGEFQGTVKVSGDIRGSNIYSGGNIYIAGSGDLILAGADCAEHFDVCGAEAHEPGAVLVIGRDGKLESCLEPYDRRVAGVVSGAGDFKSGILLDRRPNAPDRPAIALVGKVFCKVDADFAPIETGDLLTSSATPGHAMKASDPQRAFGSVIGKALQPLAAGRALLPILISLQ
jgi:hypothetical protein